MNYKDLIHKPIKDLSLAELEEFSLIENRAVEIHHDKGKAKVLIFPRGSRTLGEDKPLNLGERILKNHFKGD